MWTAQRPVRVGSLQGVRGRASHTRRRDAPRSHACSSIVPPCPAWPMAPESGVTGESMQFWVFTPTHQDTFPLPSPCPHSAHAPDPASCGFLPCLCYGPERGQHRGHRMAAAKGMAYIRHQSVSAVGLHDTPTVLAHCCRWGGVAEYPDMRGPISVPRVFDHHDAGPADAGLPGV